MTTDVVILAWHRDKHTGDWWAWAPCAFPADRRPPHYRLIKANGARNPRRYVYLTRSGLCREQIDVGGDLTAAKSLAQADYKKRIAQASLTNPPKSA